VSGMPDEPTSKPEPAVEGEVVDDVALQPDSPPASSTPAEPVDTGYTPGGVPTFDSVREKIETRYGTAIGAAELDAETPEGRTIEEQYDARQRAAAERLAEIRKSMHPEEDDAQ
jgi:phage shock protein A